MFLSIIIPVYNTEKYLAECLDSCLNQDIPRENYEILCVNDGSKDSSAKILAAYEEKFGNIHVFTKENGGVSSARNLGLDHAQGDYIWFVDADDFLQENILHDIYTYLDNQQARCDIIKLPIYEFTEVLTSEERKLKTYNQLPMKTSYGDATIWNGLYNRAFLIENHIRFDTDLKYGEDNLFGYQAKVKAQNKVVLADSVYYFYRRNINSATMTFTQDDIISVVQSSLRISELLKVKLQEERSANGKATEDTADDLMFFLRRGLERIARFSKPIQKEQIQAMRAAGLFPFKQPPECTYTVWKYANEPSGTGKLRNIFRYYSIYPWGLFLASLPYSAQRMKVRISRRLRANPFMNRVLDLKNRIIGR